MHTNYLTEQYLCTTIKIMKPIKYNHNQNH